MKPPIDRALQGLTRSRIEVRHLCAAAAATWTDRWKPTSVWEHPLKGASAP